MTAVVWAAVPLVVMLGQPTPVRPMAVSTGGQVTDAEDGYHRAVDLYRARDYAAAFEAVRRLSRRQTDQVVSKIEHLRRERGSQKAEGFGWPRREVLAAGLLQGDVTFALAGTGELEQFEDSLRLAVRILRIADTPQPDGSEQPGTWTRDWLRAAAPLMLVYGLGTQTSDVLDYAGALFPEDGPLLLTRGMLAEFESTASASATSYSRYGLEAAQDSREKALKRAAEAYEHVLTVMPESDNARARLAHVEIALGRDEAAIPLLERARNSPYPMPAYLATLMLGDIRARQGNTSAAEALYRLAITDSGGAQSAYVSLSMLEYAAGRHADAAATLDRMYAQHRAKPVDDPWWSYVFGMPQQPRAVLDALRAQVRQ